MGSPALKPREEASATAPAIWDLLIAELSGLYHHRGQSIMNPDVNKGHWPHNQGALHRHTAWPEQDRGQTVTEDRPLGIDFRNVGMFESRLL